MTGAVPVFQHGPVTYEVSAAVTGGQLVEPDTANAGKIHPAAAGSATVLGVATTDSKPEGADQSVGGSVNMHPDRPFTAVDAGPAYYKLTYAANAAFGERLVAAADGQVTPFTTGTDDASLIVGWCADPDGATSGGKATTFVGL